MYLQVWSVRHSLCVLPGRRCDPGAAPSGVQSAPWGVKERPNISIRGLFGAEKNDLLLNGYGSIPINSIFRGMNTHLPAILMFTRGTRFWHTAKSWLFWWVLVIASDCCGYNLLRTRGRREEYKEPCGWQARWLVRFPQQEAYCSWNGDLGLGLIWLWLRIVGCDNWHTMCIPLGHPRVAE